MKTIKTSELIGTALDWAVAKCEGWKYDDHKKIKEFLMQQLSSAKHCYSSVWAKGGPIIERERLCVGTRHTNDEIYWDADVLCWARTPIGGHLKYGPTPLIAAMRSYVASKLGDELDIPEELFK